MDDFSPASVMILGATGNLGLACANTFKQQGIHTLLVDRSSERLNAEYSDWPVGSHTRLGGFDLLSEGAATELFSFVKKDFGPVDVLVNTVGAFRGGLTVQDEERDTWNFLFDVNLYSALNVLRAAVPQMLTNRGGRIINVVSRNALVGAANYAAYSAAKAALLRLSEALAAETKDHNITVNCVIPGTIDTPQNRESMPDADVSRWVTPGAIADVIAFLASNAARAVTGTAIPVYGNG